MTTANRKYKSSVFAMLFQEPADLINDVSFTIDDKLVVLIEHQSTVSQNMPLRCLLYITEVYKKIIDYKKVYATNLLHIPEPEFIVLYNGVEPYPDQELLKLSDAFGETPSRMRLELLVTVYNVNDGRNQEIVQKCKTLYDYVRFITQVKQNVIKGFALEEAISRAVGYCIDHDILAKFLQVHGTEVRNVLYTEFNLDDAMQVWKEEAHEKGLKEGREQKQLEVARELLLEGDSMEKIARITKLPLEKIRLIKEQIQS